jgi:BASS family bile acid:Na+ symporter
LRGSELFDGSDHCEAPKFLKTPVLERIAHADWQYTGNWRINGAGTMPTPHSAMTSRRVSFLAVTQFIHHHLLWFLVAAYTMSAIWPNGGLGIRNLTLGVKPSHLRSLGQKTKVLLAGLAANLIIPMAYIFLVTLIMQLWYEPDEAQHILVGLALVAAMPIAGASTAWAQNSNGNLALSLGLVLASTVLSPILTPIALYVFGEMATEEYETVIHSLAAYGSGTFLGLWIVLPSLLGLAVRFLAPEARLTAILPFVKLVNSVVLLLLNYSNGSVSLPQVVADRDYDFLAVTLAITTGLCVTAFGSGYGLSRLFKVDEAERVSLMYGLGMNNNGTGLVLASLVLASYPQVMVPIILYNLVQHLVAGGVHEVMGRKLAGNRSSQ